MFLKQLSHILALGSNQTSDMFIDHCFNFLIRGTLIFYHNYKHNYLFVFIFNIEMVCLRFLEFQPTKQPSWRKIKDQNDTIHNVSKMITEILEYEKIWRKEENTKQCSAVKQEMYLEFLYQIQIGEEIGVVDRQLWGHNLQ